MFAEGETELRDLIVQNLDACGFLNKIKAEIRAGVFLAFEEEGNLRSKIPIFNKKFDEFVNSSEGKLAVSLVREFLEYFKLTFTLSVFDPEISSSTPCLNRTDLCTALRIKTSELEGPVIAELFKTRLDSSEKSQLISKENSLSEAVKTQKTLETISEDNPVKGTDCPEINSTNIFSESFAIQTGKKLDQKQNSTSKVKSTILDPYDLTSSKCETILNELSSDHDRSKVLKLDTVIKSNGGSVQIDHDDFFDNPILSDENRFFNLTSQSSHDIKIRDQNTLSSLKGLPSLTTKNSELLVYQDTPEKLDIVKPAETVCKSTDSLLISKDKTENLSQKDDIESGTESSEKQLNSEESIEEEIEEDLSIGLDDLCNYSLSLGDDATSDQTISQVSVVDGIDHIEAVTN